ncbi:unnamed protein product [Owenia fusiformis]|uniref:Endoplasmic reticulum-Golgi intermediate compartment protein 3 n=1 Tax=Owenia fusiformis TaxID=6347 RepID=A0A8J1UCM5_OWEFU|nr:unnamed protein product [Owenia fusiformis]
MTAQDLLNRLRQFDAYPKTLEDFRIKTFGGAIVTIVSGILMMLLFVSELNFYLTKDVHPELFVDTSRGQKLKINVDITFPRIACAYLSIDAMDVSGESQIDVDHNVFKQRLDLEGNKIDIEKKEDLGDKSENITAAAKDALDPKRCESCYGAESTAIKCCNTCEDVREAYRQKGWAFKDPDGIIQCSREGWSENMKEQKNEGCQMYGYLEVNKVAGNFHFAPGKSFQQHHVHVHDLQPFGGNKFNLSHNIKHLSFGTDYPGMENPLDKTTTIAEKDL